MVPVVIEASASKPEGSETRPKGPRSKLGPAYWFQIGVRSGPAHGGKNEMAPAREKNAIVAKQLQQRELMWPGSEPRLWDRKKNKGFATIPKTMPIILQIMDDLSNGKPVSSTYLGLWCETWDNSMVNTSKQQEMAHAAGFTGQRAVYTWGARMHLLHKLRFIDIKAGNSGPISHVLIWNPHRAIRWHPIRTRRD